MNYYYYNNNQQHSEWRAMWRWKLCYVYNNNNKLYYTISMKYI